MIVMYAIAILEIDIVPIDDLFRRFVCQDIV